MQITSNDHRPDLETAAASKVRSRKHASGAVFGAFVLALTAGSAGGCGAPPATETTGSGGSGGVSPTGGTGGKGDTSGAGGASISTSDTTSSGGNPSAGGAGTTAGPGASSTSTSTTGAGGGGDVDPPGDRVRAVLPFDSDWLFAKGDSAGADQAAFVDKTWRALAVPHDWAIEGPFAEANPTTGRGAYAPSGVAWYRKHFTLPQALSTRRVFIEFDGVMGNSDVYINGAHLGHHPYGYVSFRYEMTSSVKFGAADNVISVKTDTSVQPASRFYAGAGIYRHVRVLATDPVHVAQYGTYVTTPAPTAAAATVHVTTTVMNQGTSPQTVGVEGVVRDPSGAALAPVTAAPKSIAAGASADFTFDVPVTNPKLWDLKSPNMYELVTSVQVGGTTVDDDVTPFGIRTIAFNAGMTLNGKTVKFQGVANHQDYHGLGLAAPLRAVQRRLAQLKALGVNAIRTAHEPPSPDFLDLADRMGFLVLDEFTDVWTARKYADIGDYAAYFNKAATAPTGMPPVPGVAAPTWWQADFTGFIMRDRNHPSVALYSMGNEIHDSIATRTPILTKMVALSHALDPSRYDTQALLQPATAGDVGGATNTILGVWGDNYHVDDCLTALKNAPTKSGLLTEMGTETSTWATVMANPGLTGEFMWTGVDYLGEADGGWPTIGSGAGIMDELGTVKPLGYSWQGVWGAPKTAAPPTGKTASKVVLTADHGALLTDRNDVSFLQAAISDAAGGIVTSAADPVTFTLTGPGTIVAVDSGSMVQESFRGNVRKAYKGLAFAIVQATGPGTITVTASASGLTMGTATVQATTGTFVPCSGTCD